MAPSIPDRLDGVLSDFDEFRSRHNFLLSRQRAEADRDQFKVEVRDFILQGVTSGGILDRSDERRAAQAILDYWANVLNGYGSTPPESTLDQFDIDRAPELPNDLCPYVGLNSFDPSTHNHFYGRLKFVQTCIEHLGRSRFVVIVGPSGSGKSSVILGGILPQIIAERQSCRVATMVPGSDPNGNMRAALADHADTPNLLVIDQFEEVFTLCTNTDEQVDFVHHLIEFHQSGDNRVIVAMRSDFESYVKRIPELVPIFENDAQRILPLGKDELYEAILKPAVDVGLKFEDGVADALVREMLGEPAGLPLLQFTLLKLWERRERNRVTMATYKKLGGGRKALEISADETYDALLTDEQLIAKRVFLSIVVRSDGLEVMSNRVRVASLQGLWPSDRVERVINKLAEANLLKISQGAGADRYVELAHEALVRNWPRLVEWLDEAWESIQTRRRLNAKASEWVARGRGSAALLDEVQLLEAERWLATYSAQFIGYDDDAYSLVQASRKVVDEDKRARREIDARMLELSRDRERQMEELNRANASLRSMSLLAVACILMAAVAMFAFQNERMKVNTQRLMKEKEKADRLALQASENKETATLEIEQLMAAYSKANANQDRLAEIYDRGVDVNDYAGIVPWDTVRALGFKFAYVRATYGVNKDATFDYNWSRLAGSGLKRGAIHVFRDDDPVLQADAFVKAMGVLNTNDLPPTVVFWSKSDALTDQQFGQSLKLFLDRVESETRRIPVISTTPEFWSKHNFGDFSRYPLWLIEYGDHPEVPSGWKNWTMWQYRASAQVRGVPVPIAVDCYNGRVDKMK